MKRQAKISVCLPPFVDPGIDAPVVRQVYLLLRHDSAWLQLTRGARDVARLKFNLFGRIPFSSSFSTHFSPFETPQSKVKRVGL
jgi:hypothetical protein